MSFRFEIRGLMKHSNHKKAARYLEKLLWQRKRIIESKVTVKPQDARQVYVIRCKCKHDSCRACRGLAFRLYQNDEGRSVRWKCESCRHTFREGDRRFTKNSRVGK